MAIRGGGSGSAARSERPLTLSPEPEPPLPRDPDQTLWQAPGHGDPYAYDHLTDGGIASHRVESSVDGHHFHDVVRGSSEITCGRT